MLSLVQFYHIAFCRNVLRFGKPLLSSQPFRFLRTSHTCVENTVLVFMICLLFNLSYKVTITCKYFKLAQIALAGPGIYAQNGQTDDVTLGLHICYTALFGVKAPLTSVFIQRLASTHSQA